MHEREHFPGRVFASKAIYGLVTVLAVLVVMEDDPPDPWEGAFALFGTTLAVALVDAYAEIIAGMLTQRHGPSLHLLREVGRDVSPVLVGAQAPTLVLILAGLGLIEIDEALIIAQIVAFVILFGCGWRVGQALEKNWAGRLISGLVLVLVGGVIVAVKVVFH